MLSGFILVATAVLALVFGILTAWGVLSAFLFAMSRRSGIVNTPAATVAQAQPSAVTS
jgi:hypothetical protein